jgi:hypothetical protein
VETMCNCLPCALRKTHGKEGLCRAPNRKRATKIITHDNHVFPVVIGLGFASRSRQTVCGTREPSPVRFGWPEVNQIYLTIQSWRGDDTNFSFFGQSWIAD